MAAIRRRARRLVRELLDMGWDGPPFDVETLASFRGLTVREVADLAADQDACVVPGRILVNARRPVVRQRYSVVHEVAHTLFPDYEAQLALAGRLYRRDGDHSEFEQLCQVAGAELLFPLDAFRTVMGERGMSLDAVITMARDFEGSLEATARRLAETAEHPVAVLLLGPLDGDGRGAPDEAVADAHRPFAPIGVATACTSAACGAACFPIGARPPKGGAADRAWKRVALARGGVVIEHRERESWEHVDVAGRWTSEAITLPKRAAAPYGVLCLMQRVG